METMGITKQNAEAAIRIVAAVGEVIKELKEVPEGHLYAQFMSVMSLEQFQAIIAILVKGKVVKRQGYLLKWID